MELFKTIKGTDYSISKRGNIRNNVTGVIEPFKMTKKIIVGRRIGILTLIHKTWYPDAILLELKRVTPNGVYYIVHKNTIVFKHVDNHPDLYINKQGIIISNESVRYTIRSPRGYPYLIGITRHDKHISLHDSYFNHFGSDALMSLVNDPIPKGYVIEKAVRKSGKEVFKPYDDSITVSNLGRLRHDGKLQNTMFNSTIPMYKGVPVAVMVYKVFKNKKVNFRFIKYRDGDRLNVASSNLYVSGRYV